MDKVGFAKYVKFFDTFCKELNDRADFPYKALGSVGYKCATKLLFKGERNSELVDLCLIPAFPLIKAIQLRTQLESPVDHSALNSKLKKASAGVIGKEYLYTPLKGGSIECKFLHAAFHGISAFISITNNEDKEKDEIPIRLRGLMKNSISQGPLGIFEHNTLLAASLLASQACVTQADKNAAAAVVAEVAPSVTPPPYGSVTIGGLKFPNPPQGGGRRKTRRLSRGRHVRRSMSTRHRAKSHKRTVRKSQRSHR
jgi:hypothetical protein